MIRTDFNFQPNLSGAYISLRPLCEDDFIELYHCAADPKIWEQHPQSNRYEKEIFQEFFRGALESKGAFTIIESGTNKIIGSSRYYDLKAESREITVGYTFLEKKFWGGKFNRELKFLMLDHAFRFMDAVNFEIGVNNVRSRKAIEKIGACLVKRADLDRKPHVVYRMSRSQFVASFT